MWKQCVSIHDPYWSRYSKIPLPLIFLPLKRFYRSLSFLSFLFLIFLIQSIILFGRRSCVRFAWWTNCIFDNMKQTLLDFWINFLSLSKALNNMSCFLFSYTFFAFLFPNDNRTLWRFIHRHNLYVLTRIPQWNKEKRTRKK